MRSELYPFIDGNGHNAKFYRGSQSRTIIPTVFRVTILALRKLTRSKESDAYVRIMENYTNLVIILMETILKF